MQPDTDTPVTGTQRVVEIAVVLLVGASLLIGGVVFVVLVTGAVVLAAEHRVPGGWLFPVVLVAFTVGYWALVYRVESGGYAEWNDDPLAEWEDWDADWPDSGPDTETSTLSEHRH